MHSSECSHNNELQGYLIKSWGLIYLSGKVYFFIVFNFWVFKLAIIYSQITLPPSVVWINKIANYTVSKTYFLYSYSCQPKTRTRTINIIAPEEEPFYYDYHRFKMAVISDCTLAETFAKCSRSLSNILLLYNSNINLLSRIWVGYIRIWQGVFQTKRRVPTHFNLRFEVCECIFIEGSCMVSK